jgi:SAM-dependent methyltransferase
VVSHACPICSSVRTESWRKGGLTGELSPEDLRITDSRYGLTLDLARCSECGFRFAFGDQMSQLYALYERLDDPGYEGSQDARVLQMEWLVRIATEAFAGARTALDVGAASGVLVDAARRAGLDAVGVEPSASLADAARKRGLPVYAGGLPHPELADRRFDIVFLVDVIEHVAEPLQLLADCAAYLADDGVLLVVTPDVHSIAARLMGRRWWHFRLAHVGYFERSSLARAFERAGLRGERWLRARWFFPFAYLAERMERYLPVGPLNRLAAKFAPLKWLYRRTIPVNLFDSYAVIVRKARAR